MLWLKTTCATGLFPLSRVCSISLLIPQIILTLRKLHARTCIRGDVHERRLRCSISRSKEVGDTIINHAYNIWNDRRRRCLRKVSSRLSSARRERDDDDDTAAIITAILRATGQPPPPGFTAYDLSHLHVAYKRMSTRALKSAIGIYNFVAIAMISPICLHLAVVTRGMCVRIPHKRRI